MDKNSINKSSNFFRKEGFYVILFVCLCIVATVAVVTSKSGKQGKNNTPISQKNNTEIVGKSAGTQDLEYENALQVRKENKENKTNSIAKNSQNTATVTKTMDTKFVKPVEGTIGRKYSEDPVYLDSYPNTSKTFYGIDIKTELGKPVLAVLDGKILDIETNSKDGIKVTIDHQNGLKTVYGNLDSKVLVSKGQVVKKGAPIGKVGNTTVNTPYEKYGDHLYFEVWKGNERVNPERYIKY